VDVFLQDTARGETISSLVETGTTARLPDLVARTGQALREKLSASASLPVLTGAAGYSADPAAARAYSEGINDVRLFRWKEAQRALEDAVAKDPRFTLAHATLADVLAKLGYDVKALADATRAKELAAGLPREQQLVIEGRAYEMGRE